MKNRILYNKLFRYDTIDSHYKVALENSKYSTMKNTPMSEFSKKVFQKSKNQRSQLNKASSAKPKVSNKAMESSSIKSKNKVTVTLQYKADLKSRPKQSFNSSLQNSTTMLKGNSKYVETTDQ